MLVQQHNSNLISVVAESGEDVSEIYRWPEITEIIRMNEDGTIYTHIRVTMVPMIAPCFDKGLLQMTYRKCHVWFTKVENKGKTWIACGELPIPISDEYYTIEQVTYRVCKN